MPRLRPIRNPEPTHDDKAAQVNDAERKRLRERWDEFSHDLHASGAWVTSIPGQRKIRFEILEGSNLPDRMRAAGPHLVYCGSGMRLVGNGAPCDATSHAPVLIFELEIP